MVEAKPACHLHGRQLAISELSMETVYSAIQIYLLPVRPTFRTVLAVTNRSI